MSYSWAGGRSAKKALASFYGTPAYYRKLYRTLRGYRRTAKKARTRVLRQDARREIREALTLNSE